MSSFYSFYSVLFRAHSSLSENWVLTFSLLCFVVLWECVMQLKTLLTQRDVPSGEI